jgi:hypothetical protein
VLGQILDQVVEPRLFTHQIPSVLAFWHWALLLIRIFSASYSKINHGFTPGNRIGVWDCHANLRKAILFTSIVYGFITVQSLHRDKSYPTRACRSAVSSRICAGWWLHFATQHLERPASWLMHVRYRFTLVCSLYSASGKQVNE